MKWHSLHMLFGSIALIICSIFGVYKLNVHANKIGLYPQKTNVAKAKLSGTPPRFMKNEHVKRKVSEMDGKYSIFYQFKDHKDQLRTFKANFSIKETDNRVHKFGVPKAMLEPYYVTPEVIAQREKWMKDGMFRLRDNALVPDHNKMATYYKAYTKKIANFTRKSLGSTASQNQVTEFLLRFCQDIPYGIPPSNFDGKYIGQIFPPSQSLVNMYADCDSKVVLFASAYSHLRDDPMLYIHTPGHLSIAIAGNPSPYQTYTVFKNRKYIFAEPVGPGRTNFGYDNKTSHRIDRIDEVKIGSTYPPLNSQASSGASTETKPKPATKPSGSGQTKSSGGSTPKPPPTTTAIGDVMFWLNTAEYGKVTVYIDDVIQGDIGSFFRTQPKCGATGTLSFSESVGTHKFKVISRKNHTWEGSFTVKANACVRLELGK